MTPDGILLADSDPGFARTTTDLVNRMVADLQELNVTGCVMSFSRRLEADLGVRSNCKPFLVTAVAIFELSQLTASSGNPRAQPSFVV